MFPRRDAENTFIVFKAAVGDCRIRKIPGCKRQLGRRVTTRGRFQTSVLPIILAFHVPTKIEYWIPLIFRPFFKKKAKKKKECGLKINNSCCAVSWPSIQLPSISSCALATRPTVTGCPKKVRLAASLGSNCSQHQLSKSWVYVISYITIKSTNKGGGPGGYLTLHIRLLRPRSWFQCVTYFFFMIYFLLQNHWERFVFNMRSTHREKVAPYYSFYPQLGDPYFHLTEF